MAGEDVNLVWRILAVSQAEKRRIWARKERLIYELSTM